ncbi:hypothetical protein KSP39_PZI001692 [Platanthera zijinensis]|uniref:Uncharacterized protein n=1 Tax=Platanthera zijinensis TaxID=2320716 RepID=A0AAP0GEV6_9ASPA
MKRAKVVKHGPAGNDSISLTPPRLEVPEIPSKGTRIVEKNVELLKAGNGGMSDEITPLSVPDAPLREKSSFGTIRLKNTARSHAHQTFVDLSPSPLPPADSIPPLYLQANISATIPPTFHPGHGKGNITFKTPFEGWPNTCQQPFSK